MTVLMLNFNAKTNLLLQLYHDSIHRVAKNDICNATSPKGITVYM
jgi:hypothetical protein